MKGTYGSGTAGTVSYDPGIASVALGDSAVTSALMVPTNKLISGDIALSFTIDGYKTSATLNATDCGLTSLEAGKNYTIPVTISGKQLIITKVSVTPWSTGYTCSADMPRVINIQPESNCYIIQPRDTISIPISRVSTAGITTLTSTWSTGVVWAENNTLRGSLEKRETNGQYYIQVTAGTAEGNALICIKDSSGTIIWSWHIWVTSYDPNKDYISGNGCTFMDRPLGALTKYTMASRWSSNLKRHALVYQWGRKDPILRGFETLSENPINTVNHPNMVTKFNTDLGEWGAYNEPKSIHDPCPTGWRIPFGLELFNDNIRNTTPVGLFYDPIRSMADMGLDGSDDHWISYMKYINYESMPDGVKRTIVYCYDGLIWTTTHSPIENHAYTYSVRGEYYYYRYTYNDFSGPNIVSSEEERYPFIVLSGTDSSSSMLLGHQVRCVKED